MVLVPLGVLVGVLSLVRSELLRVEFSGVFVTATATLLSHLVWIGVSKILIYKLLPANPLF